MDGSTHESKQLIVERIKESTNILVTVESNPSVDELAAALALTLILNKLDKHATAVFSGVIPPAINFLEPAKTFEHTPDSLRDFIIALDKDKADRLRYKVEDDMVKIFITPYQSKLSEKDLNFSQGDFNVELVLALGVENQDTLDRAIAAHGRILHDATVATINARDEHGTLGSIDWQDGHASSICEMLAALSDVLEPKLLDAQISTALLTGIVAATDRFSNDHTSAHVMTIAAELMAAGANQQLIANSLQQSVVPARSSRTETEGRITREERRPLHEENLSKESRKVPAKAVAPAAGAVHPLPHKDDSKGEMVVHHEAEKPKEAASATTAPTPAPVSVPPSAVPQEKGSDAPAASGTAVPTVADELAELTKALDSAAANPPLRPAAPTTAFPQATPAAAPTTPPTGPPMPTSNAPQSQPQPSLPKITPLGQHSDNPNWSPLEPPTLGGTLNATTAEAEQVAAREAEEARRHNNVTLSHGTPTGLTAASMPPPLTVPTMPNVQNMPVTPALPSAPAPVGLPSATPNTAMSPTASGNTFTSLPPMPGAASMAPTPSFNATGPAPTAAPASTTPPTIADDLDAARKAVNDALSNNPTPGPAPVAPGQNSVPTASAASTTTLASPGALPPLNLTPAAPVTVPAVQPSGTMPPMPDFSTLPPLPPISPASGGNPLNTIRPSMSPGADVTAQFAAPGAAPSNAPLPPSLPPAGTMNGGATDPNQFKIPGQ